ncbi:uncharacterized protein LOC110685581 [Chenopodium quinoa]|uniref:uncharacterized protein LOC110685581 n=1 Tax=Chenopodium quinoa TaxID=63459 RepID=UPI000B770553|nr:uncharacterized protein LOC110685581 [Chenopodium quinoa]
MNKDGESFSSDFHPALGVNIIKNVIPLILDRENVPYSNWVKLFEYHTHAYNVLDHIYPKTPKPTDLSDDMWKYVLIPFSRTGFMVQFIRICLKQFCAKELQLNRINVRILINPYQNKSWLVIRLVSRLANIDFDTVAAMIQQIEPLPSFETGRSRLLLEESRRAKYTSVVPSSFVAQTGNPAQLATAPSTQHQQTQPVGHGGDLASRGRGRGKDRGRGHQQQQPQQQGAPQWVNSQHQWAAPPQQPQAI